MNFDLSNIKKVHCIGIGGIAVSADAKFMMEMGKIVSGSDARNSEIVKEVSKKGAMVHIGHKAGNLKKDVDLIIYSPAVPEDNVERVKAHKLGIREISHTEFLGFLSRQMWTVAVSGTNGKSTTTAMLGLILEKAGIDPTVIVGSKVRFFQLGNLRIGHEIRNQKFVVEGCEYKAGMMELSPKMIVLTNIEEDHLDYYKDLADIKQTFKKYVKKIEEEGVVVYNLDDENSAGILEKFRGNKVSYGIEICQGIKKKLEIGKLEIGKKRSPDVIAKNIKIKNKRQFFDVYRGGKCLGEIRLRVPGIFNVYNAMAAISAALEMGVDFRIIKKSLEKFKGIWRRFEIEGVHKGALIISDYAHHPTAIRGTIRATREFYPKRRIVAVFQPHSHNRTLKLFNEFAQSFNEADLVVLLEVYDVEGRENPCDKISSRELAKAVRGCRRNRALARLHHSGRLLLSANKERVLYAKDLKVAAKILRKEIKKNDVVLLMGAGDIFKLKI